LLGRVQESGLPLPVIAPDQPAFRALKELYYDQGSQLAHLVDSRF
jgi:hypothetical protein